MSPVLNLFTLPVRFKPSLIVGMCLLIITLSVHVSIMQPQAAITDVCATVGVQPRPSNFQPGGLILTAFDRLNLWVVNLDQGSRYPLPDTRPCGTNCHLSPDFRWISYLNPADAVFSKMRLDGTERTPLIDHATDVLWWNPTTLLVWSSGHQALLLNDDASGMTRVIGNAFGVVHIQPGGMWALALDYDVQSGIFRRVLANLESGMRLPIGIEMPYYSASAWSPDGTWLAYVSPQTGTSGLSAEIFATQIVAPNIGGLTTEQWSHFSDHGQQVRIGGQTTAGGLSWSPDGTKLAFWVIPLTNGAVLDAPTAPATIHVYDRTTGELRRYCGFSTIEHSPNPPRLIWSWDSSQIAFGANVPEDSRGYLLIALNVASGVYIELSEGIYPALGRADVVAWGLPPS